MRIVKLGTTTAIDRGAHLPGKRVTTFKVGGESNLQERMRSITHADGLWPKLSFGLAEWVESNDKELEAALAKHFGCRIGRPDDDWIE